FYSTSNFFSNQLEIEGQLIRNWHHIVFIRRGNQTLHYLDGELIHTNVVSTQGLNMSHDWYIGTFSANNPYYNELNYNFYGVIDDVYIYNRALNECEIEALYNNIFPPER
ncbi:MAG: LamG-like jellyroll fold domain-containing protein, partial [Bacteroidales bacterium]